MRSSLTISLEGASEDIIIDAQARVVTALVLLWSRDEPNRVGEIAMVPGGFPGAVALLGRAAATPDEPVPHVEWLQQRPGKILPTGPLRTPQISREQLRLSALDARTLQVENVGRSTLLYNGKKADHARVVPGDVLEIESLALFLCTARPFSLPPFPMGAAVWPNHAFGRADTYGLVGESPAAWELRQRVAFVAPRAAHVLVRGQSGTGKESVAQAIHALSPRGRKPLVSRNAATIPDTLVDAELFGNTRNYPNPGMAERPGLVGEADGASLFLDEFGELPVSVQSHLLRVLDQGEYNRLGEARPRRSDFRLIAATNRPDTVFKEDVLARFRIRVDVPDLNSRAEDIPLIARYLLARVGGNDPALAQRWFPNGDLSAAPRLSPALVTALVRRRYTTNVRELEELLWRAMTYSQRAVLEPWPELIAESENPAAPPARAPAASGSTAAAVTSTTGASAPAAAAAGGEEDLGSFVDPMTIPAAEIQAALDRNNGRLADTWKELGLSSRHVLSRLIKRYGLVVRRAHGGLPLEDDESEDRG